MIGFFGVLIYVGPIAFMITVCHSLYIVFMLRELLMSVVSANSKFEYKTDVFQVIVCQVKCFHEIITIGHQVNI